MTEEDKTLAGKDAKPATQSGVGAGTVADAPALTKGKRWRFRTSDWIALAALLLAVYAAGTKIWENQIGPELRLVPPANRVVELRCIGGADTCLGAEDGSSGPNGRMSVILPFYFVNTGAIGQNEVISRLWIDVSVEGEEVPENLVELFPVTLYVNENWRRTETGQGTSSAPFAPLLVEGRNAAGGEFRAIDFDRSDRVPWHEITAAIVEGSVTALSITLHSRTELELGDLTGTCRVEFGDRQRATLERRVTDRRAQYLATTCAG